MNIYVKVEKEDSWLKAIKTKIAFVIAHRILAAIVQQQTMFTLRNVESLSLDTG